MTGIGRNRGDFNGLVSRRTVLGTLAGGVFAGAFPSDGCRAQAAVAAPKTVEAGYLTCAIAGDLPMTGVKDGQFIGMDAEIITAIAEKLGLKTKPALMEWAATIEAVRSGRADCMLGNMGWSKPRAEVLAITDPIYYVTRFLVQKPGQNIDSVESLSGRKMGTVTGFTPIPDMKRIPGLTELKLYDTSDAVIRDVIAGRIDTCVLDGPTLDYLISRNPSWGLVQLPMKVDPGYPILTGRNHAVIGVAMGNCELFQAINQGIAWVWRTGVNKTALAKYGITNPAYLTPVEKPPRLGVDRDEANHIIGTMESCKGDFSSLFGA
jgi:polar amino acid transport system substrate-binding protein